ncbi:MAG: enoyl-CoA hydratase/isomerase family protein [Gammaproteobacteria bacterium]|nr:enoyl-CoA hydratase/isomerase family protein [Gammaproteobacteria bacterium]
MKIDVTEHGPHIAIVTIDNQPRRNAMTRQMMADLAATWDRLETSACRCVVLTGAGDKAFNAGADVSGDLSASEDTARIINRALLKTCAYPKPIIAAVNGVCAGGGVELMLASDIRLAVPDARFGLPEVKWAIYPFGGSTAKLVHQISYVHAMKLLLTAEMITADEAVRINLINEIVPRERLMERALEVAMAIAANSPRAVQAVKHHVSAGFAANALAREPDEQVLGDKVRASADFVEGVAAFRAKRQPNYE